MRPKGNYLKILIVYDTSSKAWGAAVAPRNTEKVAKAMGEVLKERGFDVDCIYVKDIDPAVVRNYDCVLAGSPTQWRKATGPIMQFMDKFGRDEFSGKLAVAFDTQLQAPLSGNASKGIEKKLEKLGFKIVMPSLVTYVQSKKDADGKNEMQLKEGELEKAKKYAEDLANKLRQ
jgi:flavodoxin